MNTFIINIIKSIKRHAQILAFDISLLKNSPRDYLYSYVISNDKIVKMYPYDPRANKIAETITKSIKKSAPGADVLFIGSSKLKIPGRRDIDLLIKVPKNEFDDYLPAFTKLFNTPSKTRRSFVEWNFKMLDYRIEISMIDPKSRLFKRQEKLHNTLNRNKRVLKEYEELKQNLNGTTQRVYIRKRLKFFNEVLKGNTIKARNIFI